MKLETRKEVADRLGVTPFTIDNWRRRGLLMPVKIGGFVRYDAEDVDKMLLSHKQPTPTNHT